jgi:hypothetical protein
MRLAKAELAKKRSIQICSRATTIHRKVEAENSKMQSAINHTPKNRTKRTMQPDRAKAGS